MKDDLLHEVWKPIKGYSNYLISNLGRVKSKERYVNTVYGAKRKVKERIIKPVNDSRGYYVVSLYNESGKSKPKLIHRLVAEAFLDNPNNYPVINHINGDKKDNRAENLEWCTQSHNIKEAFRIGTANPTWFKKYGKNHNRAKKVNQYDLDGNFIRTWDCIKEASDKLNICSSGIVMCCKNNKKYNNAGGFIWKYIN